MKTPPFCCLLTGEHQFSRVISGRTARRAVERDGDQIDIRAGGLHAARPSTSNDWPSDSSLPSTLGAVRGLGGDQRCRPHRRSTDAPADARAQRSRQDDRTIESTASKGHQDDDTDGYRHFRINARLRIIP